VIRQFVPSEVCLKCRGCCRFKEEDSAWSPCLLEEEVQGLLDKKIPSASIDIHKRIHPIANPQGGSNFVCPFLSIGDNKCKIYGFRPFECQLYPFLINLRGRKVLLTVDLNCPYIRENIKSKEFREYLNYLAAFLNSPKQLKILKENPQILQAYEEVTDSVDLSVINEVK